MTIRTTTSRALYAGNGVTTIFSFPYLFLANGDLEVRRIAVNGASTVLTLTTHYTVTGARNDAGGSVTMIVAPASGEQLLIRRIVDLTQETAYPSGDSFPAKSHERALDKLTMMVQQHDEELARTIQIPPESNVDASTINVNAVEVVAGIAAGVSAVAAIDAKVVIAANNIAAILAAPAQAAAAAASAVAAAASADAAAAAVGATIALTNDTTTNAPHYLTFADGTAGQENLKTDTAKLAYNPSTGRLYNPTTNADFGAPAGAVVSFARNSAPTGWLKANGALVPRTTYAALFSAIGTTFGVGDGSTTFGLPDLRGEFIRGWDDSRGIDSGRVFGSAQSGLIESHAHATNGQFSVTGSPSFSYGGGGSSLGTATTTNATGGAETRPRNVALLACIKF